VKLFDAVNACPLLTVPVIVTLPVGASFTFIMLDVGSLLTRDSVLLD
jgi:hypothetical protein